MGSTVWRALFLVLLLTIGSAAAAQCTLPSLRTNERPVPEGGGPTKVISSIIVADFLGVDDVNQQLDIDIRIRFSWTDERLMGLEGCRFNVTEVWFPQAILFNSSNLRASRSNARNQVEVRDGGQVVYINRYTGRISSYHNLRKFPFDRHDFHIDFGSIDDPVEDLVFVPDVENTWITDRLNIEGWHVEGLNIQSNPIFDKELGYEISELSLILSAERVPDYYVFRVLLLLAFVVGMSWTIFWVPPERFEFQIGLGATSMLTVIAFNLAIASSLPPLGYMTTLDKMLIWAIILVFLSIVEALIGGLLVQTGRQDDAERLDRASRYVFPALLFVGWLLLIFAL